jgi:outer membrane protein assembly factor BamB
VALDTVVAGFQSGELFALRVENGRTAWQDQLTRSGRTTALGALAGIVASPVIDRGRVYAVSHAGRLVSIDMASGQRVWEQDFAGINRPWPAGDWIFAVGVDSELVAFRRSDGKIRWATHLQRWKNAKKKKGEVFWYGPVLAGGQLILTSSRGEMVFVSPEDGTINRTMKLGNDAHLPPVVANGVLYVLTDDGRLSAYR